VTLEPDLLRANVPAELAATRRWLVAKDKRPHSAVDGSPVGWNAGEHRWVTLEQALEYGHYHPEFDGVGLILQEGDNLVFLDLDHVVLDGGDLEPWAAELLQECEGTYAELSVSGHGVHAFLRAPWDARWSTRPTGKTGSHLEVYGRDRFVLFTARKLDGRPSVVLAAPTGVLERLQHEHFGSSPQVQPRSEPAQGPTVRRPEAYAAAAFRNEVQRVEQAVEGERNNALNRASFALGRFAGGGLLDLDEVRDRLACAARACGLEQREADRTISSGLMAGMLDPLDGTGAHVGSGSSLPGNGADPSIDPSVSSVSPSLGASPNSRPPSGSSVSSSPGALPNSRPPSGGSVSTPPGPSSVSRAPARAQSSSAAPAWNELQPLPDLLPPVEAFDYELLPTSLRPWVLDIAERMQCPPDYPAVAAVIGLASIVGRKVGIRPKRFDDWLVVPNLWGAAIGRPGLMKTPALQEPLNPLKRLEIDAKKRHQDAMKAHETAMLIEEERRKVQKKAIGKALQTGSDPTHLAEELVDSAKDPPARRRYLVNDATVEKLGEILAQNPFGVLMFRDELNGFLKTQEKEGHENARAFYLESWNGTGRYTYDRIGRGTIDIEAAIVSILGCIQPGPWGEYLRNAIKSGSGDDGLAQRFQLAVWPDSPTTWRNVDRWPDTPARTTAYAVYQRLDELDPPSIGADRDEKDAAGIPFLRFSPEAQETFDRWREQLELRLRNDDEHPTVESHLAKFRSLIPSLALLFHLAEGGTGPVSTEGLERAIAWGHYLESHARRLYSQAIDADAVAAHALAAHICKRRIGPVFALRDLYRRGWTGLASKDEAGMAVEYLEELGWLAKTEEKTRGRSATHFHVNPRIWDVPQEGADRTDGRSEEAPSVGSVSRPQGHSGEFARVDVPSEGADTTDGSSSDARAPSEPDPVKTAAPPWWGTDRADGSGVALANGAEIDRVEFAAPPPGGTDKADGSPASDPSVSSVSSSPGDGADLAPGGPATPDEAGTAESDGDWGEL